MNKEDAAVIKVLSELGFTNDDPLTPEQEQLLKLALDPEEKFLDDVKHLFTKE